jgi:hypothetical protein
MRAISAAGAIACVVVVLLTAVPVPPVPLVVSASLLGGAFALLFPALAWNGQLELILSWLPGAAFAFAVICLLAAFNYAGVWFDNLRDPLGAISRIGRIGWRRTRVSQFKPPPARHPTHTRRYHGNPVRRPPRDL